MQSVSGYEYSQSDLIGHGAFALVFRGRKKKTHEPVAIKQIALKSVPGKLSSIRQKEIHILKELKHPNIVQLYDYLETNSDIFLIMEYCNGGDLGDYLLTKRTLSEDSICHLARHIAGSLRVLRQHHIIHRDVKPQNLLLSYPQGRREQMKFRDTTVKLADFGFARYLSGTDLAATLCGSPLYMAPEILLGAHYDSLADLWSVGTILYQCLTSTAPFLATNPHTLRKRYEKERLIPKVPQGTSQHLRSLLLGLLKKDPRERISHDDFFSHPFLRGPTCLVPGDAVIVVQPSQHTKSSPVPIRRHINTPSPSSSSPSSRRSISPRQRGSLDTSTDMFLSPSSGPPSLQPVGSGHYATQSPSSDITEQGFIVVNYPGSTGSRRYSSASSTSSSVPSHTPSSCSSLTRYNTLTTPFYQPAASSTNMGERTFGSSSIFHNPGSSPSLSRSNSGKRKSSEPSALAHTPPFSKLLSNPYTQQHSSSPLSSSPRSHSPYLYRRTNSCVSPLPTPPSVTSPVGGPGSRTHPHGMHYALGAPGSGTRLSSLAELAEAGSPQSHTFHSTASGPKLSACDDFVTPSQLLHSDEDEDEDSFPLSLSLNLSQSADDQEGEKDQVSSTVRLLAFTQNPPHSQALRSGSANRPKRAASFSQKRTNPLSQDLEHIRLRAQSLSTHGNPFQDPNYTPTPTENKTYNFSSSSPPSSIVPFKLPFLFMTSTSTASQRSQKLGQGSSTTGQGCSSQQGPGFTSPAVIAAESHRVEAGDRCLASLSQSIILGRELLAMAKARQGPIMLLSTDLSGSGVVGRLQRCSEQLVLCAKAIIVLESGLRQYQIELAASNMEPTRELKTTEAEAQELLETALEQAREVREQLSKCSRKGSGTVQLAGVSAERLLSLEALDMCKAAVLDEKSRETKECVKRYRRARLIFQHLLSDANTPQDRAILQSYIQSVQKRIQRLAGPS